MTTTLLDHFTTALADLSPTQQLAASSHLLGAFEYLNRTGATDPDQWRAAVDAACEWAVDPAAVAHQ